MALIDRGMLAEMVVTGLQAAGLTLPVRYFRQARPDAESYYEVQPLKLLRDARDVAMADDDVDGADVEVRVLVQVGQALTNVFAFETACSLLIAALLSGSSQCIGDQNSATYGHHQITFIGVDESAEPQVDETHRICSQMLAFKGRALRSSGNDVHDFLS